MSDKHYKITNYWKNQYSSKIQSSEKYNVPKHFRKMASLMAPGKSFYYVANFHTLALEMVSDSVTAFTGKDPEEVDLELLLSLALPEEIEKIHLKEKVISEFYLNHLNPSEMLDYKLVYTYRSRDYRGKERLMLHQATCLSINEQGRFVHVFSIHSDISHLASGSSQDISFINIEGGKSYYNIDSSTGTFNRNKLSRKRSLQEILSERELEIIKELALGNSADEISSKLNISPHTVKTHKKNILRKTDCKNSTQLVSICLAEGLISI
ncbi:response regulator transcription factor [Christiangramia sabulilitoris]|uniref:Helix-turn-helix transcriptional regulator n=1 Tax=Christiangramia sabulilitoris TaxID=2583991 RepID=A0A550I460_9FLAO|nr:helix-turn-helix transcriptional regulator [Christiangramia sabulilitoris]TRO65741.1 helix-turn-helix transcriptional regulator [Christiangramia sabulilitoris]